VGRALGEGGHDLAREELHQTQHAGVLEVAELEVAVAPARETHLWHQGKGRRTGAPGGGEAGANPAQRLHAGPPPGGHRRPPALEAGALAGHQALPGMREGRAGAGPQAAAISARRRWPPDWVADARRLTPPSSPRSSAHASLPQNTCARTVVGSSRCSVCEVVELRGRQTVCSAACRRDRSRRREAERRQARDREIAALLEAALRKLQEALDDTTPIAPHVCIPWPPQSRIPTDSKWAGLESPSLPDRSRGPRHDDGACSSSGSGPVG